MNRKGWSMGVVLLLLGFVAWGAAAAVEPRGGGKVAELAVGAAGVEWLPAVAGYDRLVLTVSGPDGLSFSQEFKAGVDPALSLFDAAGQRLPDGGYTWELRVVPRVAAALAQRLKAAREAGDQAAETALRRQGGLAAEPLAQSGHFAIQGGALVQPDLAEPSPARGKRPASQRSMTNLSLRDQVIADDLIVQGSACIGLDCVNNESFGFDTIRLKENNTRIKFDDTSTGTGFPNHDWQLTANDSASGGANKFSIEDITAATVPFTITGSAPTNAIFVDSSGRVGFRTATPVLDLHVATSNTPAMRLEQNGSGGFTAQTWDIAGNEANFFVRDVTGGSRLPFRIRPGAPTSSIDINASGNVGIGTASPSTRLTLSDGVITIGGLSLGQRSGATDDLQVNALRNIIFGVDSNNDSTNASFSVSRNNDPNQVIFVAREDNLVGINLQTPSFPLHVGTDATNGNGAHLTAAGIWTDGSSRANKENIRALDSKDAFAALVGLEPVRYNGKNSPDGEEYLGFIAEDVPDLVAMNNRKGLSPMDIVAVLTKVVQEQEKTIHELAVRVNELETMRKTASLRP